MINYLAIDIGGTDTKYGIVNKEGDIIETGRFSSKQADGFYVLREIQKLVRSYLHRIKGLAISVPGFIDVDSGFIENGGSLRDFDQFNMKTYLESELSLPVTIENDVNCVAYAEKWLGHAKEDASFLCMTIGTGVGGALFLDDKLFRGVTNRAGEFGYIINREDSNDPLKNSYNMTATTLMLRRQFASIKKIPLNKVTGKTVFNAFDDGDADAERIVTAFYDSIAKMIYNLYYIIDPGKILIGGGISQRATFIDELKIYLSEYGVSDDMIEVNTCYFKNFSGIIGATYHHIHNRDIEKSQSR